MGHGMQGSVLTSLAQALLQAAIAVGAIVLFGRFLMRPLLHLVAQARSRELFVAAVLFVIVAAGVIANRAGLSMALGAFVAGLLLAETEYGKAVQSTVEPFKGLLLGMFFFTVGMNIDLRELVREPLWLAACVAALILGKSLVSTALGRLYRLSWSTSIETGLLLAAGRRIRLRGRRCRRSARPCRAHGFPVRAGRDLHHDGVDAASGHAGAEADETERSREGGRSRAGVAPRERQSMPSWSDMAASAKSSARC